MSETDILQHRETSVETGGPTPAADRQTGPVVEDVSDERLAVSVAEEPGDAGSDRDDSQPEDGNDTVFEDGDAAGQAGTDADDAPEDSGATSGVGGEPAYTDRELNAAKRFGFDPENLDALGEQGKQLAERLAKIDSEIGRRYSKIGQTERVLRERESASGTERDDAEQSEPSPEEPPRSGQQFEHDDRLDAMAQEVERLRGHVGSLVPDRESADRRRAEAATDRFFAELDPEVYPQFGRGRWADLPEDSDQFQRRAEVATKAGEILRGYELVHGEPMEVAEALGQALAILAPEARVAADRRKLSDDLRQRARQRIARPTQRRTARAYESSEQRTVEALDHWEKARGVRFFND